MKFEIITKETHDPETVKVRTEIASNGDLDIYINDMLIFWLSVRTGRLCRVRVRQKEYLEELKKIGISMDTFETASNGYIGGSIQVD